MWVADMDFKTPDFILKAIQNRLEHPVLGYTFHSDSQYQSIIDWIDRRHQWAVEKDWIGFAPGVVPALNLAIQAFTKPKEKIIIQTPVYFPFYSAVTDHNRELVLNPLQLEGERYVMDLDLLEKQIDRNTRMLILCSPHNPTGNVWRENELNQLVNICEKHDILIISDEIHADIVYPDNKHIPTAKLSEKAAQRTITLMAPSKTFNFAGLATSYYIIPNRQLFTTMKKAVDSLHLSSGNITGNVALEAAYTKGDEWLRGLIEYLGKNISFTQEFINNQLPDLKLIPPEATFLLWIDFRSSGLDDKTIRERLVKKAGIALSNGIIFGKDGEGFQRLNIGCPQKTLEKALQQLTTIFKQ
jgi:cystathionine beta-lyase